MSFQKENQHERDARISFEPVHHRYSVDGEDDYVSVTTLIKEFFPKFDSTRVIARMQQSSRWKDSVYFGRSAEEIEQQWSDKAAEASRLGTLLHRAIEDHYHGCLVDNSEVQAGFAQFLAFDHDRLVDGLVPFRTEWCVFHEEYHVAGSIDMVFRDPFTGDLHIYDWKRTASIKKTNPYESGLAPIAHLEDCNYNHYSLQLNMYQFILESKYGYTVRSRTLICLHPDNQEYVRVRIPCLQKEVVDLLNAARDNKK